MKKKLTKVVAAIGMVILAAWLVALPLFMNKNSIKSELKASFDAATGMQLEIQGDATVKIFPLPHMVVDSMYVLNSPGAKSPFLLTIKTMEIWPAYTSLFGGGAAIRKLLVNDVDIEMEALSDGRLNLEEMSSFWNNGVFQAGNVKPSAKALRNISIAVNRAQMNYTRLDGTILEFGGISILSDVNTGSEKAAVNLRFTHQERPYAISAHVSGGIEQIFSSASANFDFTATSDKSSFAYEGTAGFRDNNGFFNGKLKLDTDDLAYWVRSYRGEKVATGADYRKIPVNGTANVVMAVPRKVQFADIALDGPTIKGGATVDVALPDHMDVKAQIHMLNLEDIIENGFVISAKEEGIGLGNAYVPQNQPPRPLSISSNVKIDDMVYNGRHIFNTSFSTEMEGKDFTLPQLTATLPGETHLSFAGIGKIGLEGVTVEGQTDVIGNDLYQALSTFKPVGIALPPEDFKRFHLRTNTLVSLKEIRLSELIARIGNTMALTGGMIIKQGPRTNMRAAFGISGMNLDHFMERWGLKNWEKSLFSTDPVKDDSGIITIWLKRLGYDMYITTALEKYTFNGKPYEHANLSLAATLNRIRVEVEGMPYNGSLISGKVTADVSGVMPKIDLQADLDNFDKDVFFAPAQGTAQGGENASQDRWSTDIMDFRWLGMVNGTFNMKFGHFRDKAFAADNLTLTGGVADQKLNITSIKANVFGAGITGKATIAGGTIPTASFVASIAALNMDSLARLFPILHGVSGTANASVVLSTNGINLTSWVSNLAGTVGVSGRDIEVHNFNLPGIIRAVSYVRQVSDIVGVVQRMLPKGSTLFSGIEGEWNIAKGLAATSRLKIISDQSEGTLVNQVDLVHWTTGTNITFALKVLDAANPPTVTVKLTGDMDAPAMELDTRSLEQYVNNKTSERMLQGYGAH